MTREIKFRGKATHGDLKGQWVVGSFVNYPGNPTIINIRGSYNIDLKTLGQFVDLKDYALKDLWEGDLVRPENDATHTPEPIVFENGCFEILRHNDAPLCDYLDNILLVGNIHDNPELIGGGV